MRRWDNAGVAPVPAILATPAGGGAKYNSGDVDKSEDK